MRIDKTSMFFNCSIPGETATVAWSTQIGQSKKNEYRIRSSEPGLIEILIGLDYCSKSDSKNLDISKMSNNRELLQFAVFDQVYVNNIKIENCSFILLLVKEHTQSHDGRISLSYPNYASYERASGDVIKNKESIEKIAAALEAENGCWFVHDISVKNQNELHFSAIVVDPSRALTYDSSEQRSSTWDTLIINAGVSSTNSLNSDLPRNKIIYGAPGTGKSFELREQAENAGFNEENIIRITFHPNYSYQQFVGSYKPTPIYKGIVNDPAVYYGSDKSTPLSDQHKKDPLIDYRFVPGPFMNLLVNAINHKNENYLLIIEEINRAPVSAVFGDVFQLLDRNSSGESEYSITFNEDAKAYLASEGIKGDEIKIPSNFFIWATMNSADQGVMPLDSAFKRRWSFEYLPLDAKEEKVKDQTIIFQGNEYNWNDFRNEINLQLKVLGIAEDKLIGPFFLNKSESKNKDVIKNKLLLYLRDDVMRHDPKSIFKKDTFSDIIKDYDLNEPIFVKIDFSSLKIINDQLTQ